ncbi:MULTISPECIES: GNAT family N-acetyltransferase [unclassified Microbacterium]|uniref:GNAT family N-acetyltransferase n=1 Tax=unclassified Microbacterium TaxID=2609290 RepID=UPI000EA95CBC|nr:MULTISPECIES: GNAT family N-acetyltransferase [unclassified Microbacterium]MBT2485621.1 GNAT family N-acetyltransferase [Microbacterium sp. ISL-108]RKN68400.1 N-acetyltransferase [Microbacterium sp. CGR2]
MESLALRLWQDDDLSLLHRANTPEMTAHLNGPETEEQIAERHARYLRLVSAGDAKMFAIVADGRSVGSIGSWKVRWRDRDALETGWFVLPEAQGRGVAAQALGLLIDEELLHADGPDTMVAFPEVDNGASNAVCRRAGFRLEGSFTEAFRGRPLVMNEWVRDLRVR